MADPLEANPSGEPNGLGNVPLDTLLLDPKGQVVHLQGYGFIKVFQTVGQDGDMEYWASSALPSGTGH